MNSPTVHHAGRTVADMEKALGFYRDLVGLTVVDDAVIEGDNAFAELLGETEVTLRAVFLSRDGRPPYLELFAFSDPSTSPREGPQLSAQVGSTHACILVDDLHAEYERLTQAGVRFTRPPVRIDEGPFAGQWVAYGFDPDGGVVEFWCEQDRPGGAR